MTRTSSYNSVVQFEQERSEIFSGTMGPIVVENNRHCFLLGD